MDAPLNPRRVRRPLVRRVRLVALALVAVAVSLLLQLQLPLARRVVSNWVTELASGEITGALVIGRFESIAPHNIVARNLTLWDARGNAIINADRLVLRLDLIQSLLSGSVLFSSATLTGARVRLVDTGDGLPTLLTTFDSSRPGNEPDAEPLQIVVSNIQLNELTMYGDLLGLEGFRAEHLKARGLLRIGDGVRARIDGASAVLTEPFGYSAQVQWLTGAISTSAGEGIQLRASVRRGDEHAVAQIRYAPPPDAPSAPDELDLRVHVDTITADTLHGLGYDWVPDLGVPIAGDLRLHGPTETLRIAADIASAAGPVRVNGSIADATGVGVTLTTPGVELAQLMPEYPEVHAAGQVQVTLGPLDEHARLRLKIEPLVWGGLHVPAFTLDGMVLDDGLRIDRIEGRGRGSRVSGSGLIREDGRLSLELHASFEQIHGDPNFKRWARGAEGRLRADMRIERPQGGQSTLDFSGTIIVHDFQLGMLHARRLDLRGSARGDPQRPRLSLSVGGAEVHLGEYLLGAPRLSLRGGPREYRAEGQFVSAGKRTFNVDARVKAERDGFAIDADPIEFTVGAGTWRGAMQGLRLRSNNRVQLGLLRLASRSQRLEAHGQLSGGQGEKLEAELQNFDLAALRALVGDQLWLEQGHADARIVLGGSAREPDLLVQGALRGGVMGDVDNINALYLVRYRPGMVEANGELELGKRGLLRVDGRGTLERRPLQPLQALLRGSYELTLSADKLALDLLPAITRAKISGALSGELSVRGTLQRPELNGSVEVAALTLPGATPLDIGAQGSFQDGQMRGKLSLADPFGPIGAADAELRLDWRAIAADPQRATALLMRGPWRLSGYTSERRLDTLPAPLSTRLPYPAAVATRFNFSRNGEQSQGELEFNLDWQQPVSDGVCAQDARAKGHGVLRLAAGQSQVEFQLFNGPTRIADFHIALDTPIERWAEHARFEAPRMLRSRANADVAAIQQVPYLCEYGDGRLKATLELDGGLTTRPLLAMRMDTQFLPRLQRTSRRRQAPTRSCDGDPIRVQMQVNADRELLTGNAHMEGCNGGNSDLRGRMAVQWNKYLVLPAPAKKGAVQARLSLEGAELKPLLERIPDVIYAQAKARGEITLGGTVENLNWGGQLGIEGGRMYLVSPGQELTDINTWVEFHGNWAKIDDLQAKVGNGRLSITGGLGFAGIVPNRARLAFRARDLPVKREGIEIAALTGNIGIDAVIQPEGTRAKIQLDELQVRLPEESNRALQALGPHQEVLVVTEAPNRALTSYPFDIEVSASDRVTVQRDDFQARIQPALRVRYADPDLNVDGLITFHAGEFEVFGKRFAVTTGSLRFDGGSELNPEIYLMATQKPESTGAAPVSVWVTGTLQQPEVTFNVDVCSGESAAINYLLSGQCGSETEDAFSQDTGNAPAAFAAGVIGGFLTLGAQRELKGLAPRIAIERTEGAQRVHAGFSSESLIPEPLRGLVKRIYIAGGVLSPDAQSAGVDSANTAPENPSLEFLIELYFPHNLVGSARAAPPDWALDLLWEP